MKKISRKEILGKLKQEGKDKKKVTLYLSASLYKEFQNACDGVPASNVVEELIKLYIERP